MGNSNNKVAPAPESSGCCSSPVICTAHLSCSVPVWCCAPNCCSEPKVEPASERDPLSSAAGPNTPNSQPAAGADTAQQEPEIKDDNPEPAAPPAASAAAANPDAPIDSSATTEPGSPQTADKDKDDVDEPTGQEKPGSPRQSRPATNTGEPDDGAAAGDVDGGPAETAGASTSSAPAASLPEPEVDEEVEELTAFAFEPETLVTLEQFGLRESAEVLVGHSAGRAAVQEVQLSCVHASDAGAASHNCKRLLAQVKRIADVLARALELGGRRRLVRHALEELQPILQRTQATLGSWCHKGPVDKFFSGRDADNEFLHLHLQLKDCCQGAAFTKLLQSLPPGAQHQPPSHSEVAPAADQQPEATDTPKQDADGGQDQPEARDCSQPDASGVEDGTGPSASTSTSAPFLEEPGGYASVEASKEAFERLLLLFILRYKPSKKRSQKQRMLDLLRSYNTMSGSVEEKLEHLTRARLDKTAPAVLPLLESIMTNMWGATEIPAVRIEKWRLAVRLALEPILVATGEWQLPQAPEEGAEPFTD